MNRIIDWFTRTWRKVPRAVRSGWITAWIVFTGGLLSIVTSLLPTLANAISTKDFAPFFDSLSLAYTASLSLALAFVSGLVNSIYRWLKPIEQAYRTDPPDTEDPPSSP